MQTDGVAAKARRKHYGVHRWRMAAAVVAIALIVAGGGWWLWPATPALATKPAHRGPAVRQPGRGCRHGPACGWHHRGRDHRPRSLSRSHRDRPQLDPEVQGQACGPARGRARARRALRARGQHPARRRAGARDRPADRGRRRRACLVGALGSPARGCLRGPERARGKSGQPAWRLRCGGPGRSERRPNANGPRI